MFARGVSHIDRLKMVASVILGIVSLGVIFTTLSYGSDGPVRRLLKRETVVVESTTPATPTATTPATRVHGKVFYGFVRLKVAAELRKNHGYSFADARHAADSVTDELIESASKDVKIPVGAFGDGTILKLIMDFFASPQGQALLDALIKLLISLIGV